MKYSSTEKNRIDEGGHASFYFNLSAEAPANTGCLGDGSTDCSGKTRTNKCVSQLSAYVTTFLIVSDTVVKLKDDQANEFESILLFTDSGISMKNKFNGANEVQNSINESAVTYG